MGSKSVEQRPRAEHGQAGDREGQGVSARYSLTVVAVVPVVTQPASRHEPSKAAADAASRSRLGGGLGRDLALGVGARGGAAPLGRGLGGLPLGFLLADTLDVELRCKEQEDHAHGRDRDRDMARAGQRWPHAYRRCRRGIPVRRSPDQ